MSPRIDEHVFDAVSLSHLEWMPIDDDSMINDDTQQGSQNIVVVSTARHDENVQELRSTSSQRIMIQHDSSYKIRNNTLLLLLTDEHNTAITNGHGQNADDEDETSWSNKPSLTNEPANPYIVPIDRILMYLIPFMVAFFLFALRLEYNLRKEIEEELFQRKLACSCEG